MNPKLISRAEAVYSFQLEISSTSRFIRFQKFTYLHAMIIISIALGNAPYKMLHKLKSACSIREKNNTEQVRFDAFRKSLRTNRSLNSTGNPTAGI